MREKMKRCLFFLCVLGFIFSPCVSIAGSESKVIKSHENKILHDLNDQRSENKIQNKFHLLYSNPFALSYILKYQSFHLNQNLLIIGSRPAYDKPENASTVFGKQENDNDWLLEEGSSAIWVKSIPGPVSHEQIIVLGSLEEKGGNIYLNGQYLINIGNEKEKKIVLHKGEYIFYALPGSRSNTCPVELYGDSVAIAYYDPFDAIILEAVKAGPAKLKVFSLWWRDSQPEFIGEYEILVN